MHDYYKEKVDRSATVLTVIGPCVFHLHVCSMTPRIREFAEACCMCLCVCVDRRPWSAVVSVQHRPASQQVLSVLVSDVEWALCFRRFTLRERQSQQSTPAPTSPRTQSYQWEVMSVFVYPNVCATVFE